ncbi:ArsR/SmtB family transcription factor [Dactylosporangium matsuzakiense]|uniref:ArsR/SmtB family transcription factor n=1 Tax=Dactylosporangium matsuzakiense TaxID=53360 RepID=UPI0021C49B35|nr:metalloregulator ArsR/SmtB family transcription factor [Dactylosporangium matsuzakiense]UWZ50018.1 metalloregulator ArsR/SmtB family transcription factor [Dactylosporangium matsuzakiense]
MLRDDDVFRALADGSRRTLLDRLDAAGGQTLRELCAGLGMTRQSVSKHLTVLEEAGLVTSVRRGREKLHYLNAAPVSDIAERWINRYHRRRVDALADLKKALEGTPMSRPEFVYTTYIRTTPEQLWKALTEPAFTRQYWGVTFDTDWRPGSTMTWRVDKNGTELADPEQVVLAAEPYTRLSFTWHTMSEEWAKAFDIDLDYVAKVAHEPRSRATFEIEQQGEHCKLTVVHDGFDADSLVLPSLGDGWPQVIASLKSLLETGRPL